MQQPELSISASSFVNSFIDLFQQSYAETDMVVHVCFLIIVFGFGLAFICVVAIFAHRVVSQRNVNRTKQLKEKYELLLTGIIFDEQDETFETRRNKLVRFFQTQYLKSKFAKRVLRKEILTMHRSFSGPAEEILRSLYIELNLDKSAMQQLSSTDWSEKADAVKELSQLRIKEAEKKLSNSPHTKTEFFVWKPRPPCYRSAPKIRLAFWWKLR